MVKAELLKLIKQGESQTISLKALYRMVKGIVKARALEPMAIRGKADLVQVYEVLG